jgi:hypothetical protein
MWTLLALAAAAVLLAACLATDLFPGDGAGMVLFLAASVAISLFLLVGLGTYAPKETLYPVRNYSPPGH